MRRLITAVAITTAAAFGALAQTTDKAPLAQDPVESMQKPSSEYEHPPTGRMDEATPTQKSGEEGQHPPSGRMDTATPPMKATDPAQKNAASTTQTFADATLTDDQAKEWIGRSVYSSDGQELGEIAELKRGPDYKVTELYLDIGGFLGLGETRVRATSDKIQEIREDRVILNLTEADAKSLPQVEN
jgi:hypothetical protein